MVDPVSNEAASKLAQTQTERSRQQGDAVSGASSSDGPSFQEVLEGEQSADAPSSAEAPDQAPETRRAESPDRVEMDEIEEMNDLESAGTDQRRVKFREFMEGISEDRHEIDEMLEQSMNGANLDQKELLEMQALIYSYSQKVELTSKVVEKGTGGLKQMMQMRV